MVRSDSLKAVAITHATIPPLGQSGRPSLRLHFVAACDQGSGDDVRSKSVLSISSVVQIGVPHSSPHLPEGNAGQSRGRKPNWLSAKIQLRSELALGIFTNVDGECSTHSSLPGSNVEEVWFAFKSPEDYLEPAGCIFVLRLEYISQL